MPKKILRIGTRVWEAKMKGVVRMNVHNLLTERSAAVLVRITGWSLSVAALC